MITTKRRTYLRCTDWKCKRAKLVRKQKGQSFQSGNGFIIAKVAGLYCPVCGGSYGGNNQP